MMKSYTLAKEVIQRLILKSGNNMFSATTDLWTSGQQNVGYICVTLHWINADFELIHLLIAFEELPQPHSGVNLAVVLYRIFNSWNKYFSTADHLNVVAHIMDPRFKLQFLADMFKEEGHMIESASVSSITTRST
jgi:hypothetical protein